MTDRHVRRRRAKVYSFIAISFAGMAWLAFPLNATRVLAPVCLFFSVIFTVFALAEHRNWW